MLIIGTEGSKIAIEATSTPFGLAKPPRYSFSGLRSASPSIFVSA
jgi:hypothetical protein